MRRGEDLPDDEWYTYYNDIETELMRGYYSFSGEVVYCSCDKDESNFIKFFKTNFKKLGLKKLAWSHIEYDIIKEFDGNTIKEIPIYDPPFCGDCRSYTILNYCIDNNALIVTNPPFSLLVDYICRLKEYKLRYIMITNLITITQRRSFYLWKNRELFIVNNRINNFFNNNNTKNVNGLWINNLGIEYNLKDAKFCELDDLTIDKDYIEFKYLNMIVLKKYNIPVNFKGNIVLPTNFLTYKRLKKLNYTFTADNFKDRRFHDTVFSSCYIYIGDEEMEELKTHYYTYNINVPAKPVKTEVEPVEFKMEVDESEFKNKKRKKSSGWDMFKDVKKVEF